MKKHKKIVKRHITCRDTRYLLKTKNKISLFRLIFIIGGIFLAAYYAGSQSAGLFRLFPRANSFGWKTKVVTQQGPAIIPFDNPSKCDDKPGGACYDYGDFIGSCTDPYCVACKGCNGVGLPGGFLCSERKCYRQGNFKGCGNNSCTDCPEYNNICKNLMPSPTLIPSVIGECYKLDCGKSTATGGCGGPIPNPEGSGKECDRSVGLYADMASCSEAMKSKCPGFEQNPTSSPNCIPHDWRRCTTFGGNCCENWGDSNSCGWNNGAAWQECQSKCGGIANSSSPFCQGEKEVIPTSGEKPSSGCVGEGGFCGSQTVCCGDLECQSGISNQGLVCAKPGQGQTTSDECGQAGGVCVQSRSTCLSGSGESLGNKGCGGGHCCKTP